MMDFTTVLRLCYIARNFAIWRLCYMKEFWKWNEGSALFDFEFSKKEINLGGPDLIRWAILTIGT